MYLNLAHTVYCYTYNVAFLFFLRLNMNQSSDDQSVSCRWNRTQVSLENINNEQCNISRKQNRKKEEEANNSL